MVLDMQTQTPCHTALLTMRMLGTWCKCPVHSWYGLSVAFPMSTGGPGQEAGGAGG